MKKGSLVLVPSGGLANRMRAIASAFNACRNTGSSLQVVWFRDWALNAAFGDIFEPLGCDDVSLREAGLWDFLVNDRPRRRNLWLPRQPQMLIYQHRIDEKQVTPLKRRGFSFEDWMRGCRCWMSCYQVFGDVPDGLYGHMFRPVGSVRERVEDNVSRFSAYTVGMHIRRTDNVESIEKSPTELFVEAARRELSAHPDLRIFLATDSERVKAGLRSAFTDRVITSGDEASRLSADGIRGGLVDMYSLARTCRIYGSAGSSFSVMASAIGGVELTVLER